MTLRLMYREHKKYQAMLDEFIEETAHSTHQHRRLGLFSQPEHLKSHTQVYGKHGHSRKELVYAADPVQPTEREEVIFTVQGYVLRCNLPPITKAEQLPKNPMAAKQSVTLTGLGSKEFELSARAVLQIHTLFGTTLPEDVLAPWKPTRDGDHVCLEFSNRYFKGKGDDEAAVLEISSDIDPLGILQARCGNGEYTEDNQVLYYQRHIDTATGHKRYVPCKPVGIRVGQLVEVQTSFCVVPITKGRFIMLNKLRSICIINTRVQDDLNESIFTSARECPTSPTRRTKRNIGYPTYDNVEETEDARIRLKRMRIDETNMD